MVGKVLVAAFELGRRWDCCWTPEWFVWLGEFKAGRSSTEIGLGSYEVILGWWKEALVLFHSSWSISGAHCFIARGASLLCRGKLNSAPLVNFVVIVQVQSGALCCQICWLQPRFQGRLLVWFVLSHIYWLVHILVVKCVSFLASLPNPGALLGAAEYTLIGQAVVIEALHSWLLPERCSQFFYHFWNIIVYFI